MRLAAASERVAGAMIEKSPEAFRTISEVADDLDLPQHVLRFWETRFTQIKPLKRGGRRRYYRPEDVDLLRGIRHLLYGEGYTIKGVQRILKEQGVRTVAAVWKQDVERRVSDAAPDRSPGGASAEGIASRSPDSLVGDVGSEQEVSSAPDDDPLPPDARQTDLAPAHAPSHFTPPADLAREDFRRLKAILSDLVECRRILDDARRGS